MRARILALDGGADRELVDGLASVVAGYSEHFEPLEVHPACGLETQPRGSALVSQCLRNPPQCLVLCLPEHGIPFATACFDALRGTPSLPPVFCLARSGTPSDLKRLWKLGARDLLLPPVRISEWGAKLLRSDESNPKALVTRTLPIVRRHPALSQIIGDSPAWHASFGKVPNVANWNVSVLIRGETGTGKELCARAIHDLSSRASRPFVPLNCGAVPVDLIENELFGHERGAFTGAVCSSTGLVQEAEGGTLFFDEVDALPPSAQVKLLRLLQNKTYRRLGSTRESLADIRVIAATNADLKAAVAEHRFREDLYYRINVFELILPPLRQRVADIRLLAAHFLDRFASEQGRPSPALTAEVIHALEAQRWPGNIRELENVIQRALIVAEGRPLSIGHLNLPADHGISVRSGESFQDLKAQSVAMIERHLLTRFMDEHDGNITRASRAAKKNRRAFWQLLKKHGLHGSDPRCRPSRVD